jgi:hypothetical protein
VPVIFTGIAAPAPSFLKNGSAGFNSHDFQRDVTYHFPSRVARQIQETRVRLTNHAINVGNHESERKRLESSDEKVRFSRETQHLSVL